MKFWLSIRILTIIAGYGSEFDHHYDSLSHDHDYCLGRAWGYLQCLLAPQIIIRCQPEQPWSLEVTDHWIPRVTRPGTLKHRRHSLASWQQQQIRQWAPTQHSVEIQSKSA